VSSYYFLPYQQAWIRDGARLRICQKGRQIGMSYADSYDSVRKAAVAPARDVWVMSRDEAQAKQYIRYCKRWAKVLNYAARDLARPILKTTAGKAIQVQALTFASRATIFALSSNPDAIVGKTGHVKLDEFALHRDQRTLYAVAKPVTQWGGTLSILSTHRGAHTVFNELITEIEQRGNPMGWALHTIPIQRAVEDGLVERIDEAAKGALSAEYQAAGSNDSDESDKSDRSDLRAWWLAKQRAECIDQEQWLQEYCCVPADEATAFIPYDLLTACTEPDLRLIAPEDFIHSALRTPHSALYLGVDVARKKDLCVLDVGEKIGDVVWDRVRIELLNRPFAEIEAELYRLLRLPQVKRACIDATGLGAQLAERARQQFGWKIEPIVFTARIKEDLATGLKIDLEKRHVRLVDDETLRADLRGIRKEVTLSGNSRYAGEIEGSHCDRFWAKALRQHAAHFKICAGALVA
jgi:phage FluMu gp28-like protein